MRMRLCVIRISLTAFSASAASFTDRWGYYVITRSIRRDAKPCAHYECA